MENKWIIAISNTATESVKLYQFNGSRAEIKAELVSLVNEDRSNDTENWLSGSDKVNLITDESAGMGLEFSGYGTYTEYNICYTAKILKSIKNVRIVKQSNMPCESLKISA